jgi:hypothetical protein
MGQPCFHSIGYSSSSNREVQLFLVYIDDSGDEHVRCFSALVIHESRWKATQAAIKSFRRQMKASDGLYVTKELHATTFIAGRGRIGTRTISKDRRFDLFLATLQMIAALPEIRMFNAMGSRGQERMLFERLVNRINRTMAEWRSHALIIHDEGKDYAPLVRRMAIYNPIQSRYGRWEDGKEYKNIPIDRVIEEIVYRKSHQSDLIQMADFCAYALFRSEHPHPNETMSRLGQAFDVLRPACITAAYTADPKRLGIIRC